MSSVAEVGRAKISSTIGWYILLKVSKMLIIHRTRLAYKHLLCLHVNIIGIFFSFNDEKNHSCLSFTKCKMLIK